MVSLGVMPGIAAGSQGDFAAGGGFDGVGHFNFSAHQIDTQSARGHMTYRSPTQVVRADVVCLNVQGSLAFVLGVIDQSRSSGIVGGIERVAFEVLDDPAADTFGVFFANPSLGCSLPPLSGQTVVHGNLVVHDNTP
jgi:hypothetical protein